MALHTDSPSTSAPIQSKSHVRHPSSRLSPTQRRQQRRSQKPLATIHSLPKDVLLHTFHYLQPPLTQIAPSSKSLPLPTRLVHVKSATRCTIALPKKGTRSVPWEVHLSSVCKRWREVSYQLPHACILDLAAYLPSHRLVRVCLSEKGLDRAYDLWANDIGRMAAVKGLNIHIPGVSATGVKSILRKRGRYGLEYMQLIFRRGDWLATGDGFDADMFLNVLQEVADWLEYVNNQEADHGSSPSLAVSDIPIRGLSELRLHSYATVRTMPPNLISRLAMLCAGLNSSKITEAADDMDSRCGVLLNYGTQCMRCINCTSHSVTQKKAVTGRSRPFEALLSDFENRHRKSAAVGLTTLSLRGIYSPYVITAHAVDVSSHPAHVFARYNPTIKALHLETGPCDLGFLSESLPWLESLQIGDVATARGNLSGFKGLECLELGREEALPWVQNAGEGVTTSPDGYAAGRLLRTLSPSTCARLKSLHVCRAPLADVMHIFESDDNDDDNTLHSDIRSFQSIYVTTIPRLTVANLVVILNSSPLLDSLHVSIDESACMNVEVLKRAFPPATNLRKVVFKMADVDYAMACRRGLLRTLEYAKPRCRFELQQDVV
ncbi:uncharacterized protein SPPG_03966 [Spizellomyces punctatus DAOM BR117]|uniref:SCA7 domain-containing protein n=1 Tax=Spizellomyces punctatus (strain DAOM BR117) TaxID=645134 RepID=A0A0L0HIA7_SPIPD|nr:uncharacterized protein SPPG_03966 [Spizellomyces punctatus DAOM BR117]KND00862.1 hypothetical protein SPPG_03966 [Spizellomyces punctatus DAOM BR117]|eukprot:XP_016608901.1 hypothetical protein SPPG_03966 [Spizellomyces punctatus DAOM BR117]